MLDRDLNLQRHLRRYIERYNWNFAATLTLKQGVIEGGTYIPLDEMRASGAMGHALRVINRKIWPNAARNGKFINAFPVLEGDRYIRYHYHALLERPPYIEPETFSAIVSEAWEQKTIWGRSQTLVTACDRGWSDYITKLKSKSDFGSSIDWMNVHVPKLV